jgi:hypothetical protein
MLYILYHAGTGRKNIWVSLNATLVRTQLKEYEKDVSTSDKGKSALVNVCYTQHKIVWENSKIITTNNPYGQIRLNCLET